ncbi:tetratricopeptide repeat protein [Luteitalea sp. TBR-22]|uniref:tetratricopeptide repeat protein n=1 Tax=Luteitalea sp. TBR-22 TaxID=2802971 RepID=UPI001EF5BEC4|nr:tetratricopeptide repeat protein [Luteitalea sp. TBR-22]
MRALLRIAFVVGGLCLPATFTRAQGAPPAFTVPRIITPGVSQQPAASEPAPEVVPAWRRPLVEGRFDEALAQAADVPWARAYISGRAAERRGAYDEAEQSYRVALVEQPTGEPAVALAELLTLLGRRDEAVPLWSAILRAGQAQRTGTAIGRAARAAQALTQVRLANSYFQSATNLSPDDAQIHTRWGDLFLEKFNEAEARSSYETALKADSRYVPAMVGLARSLADSNPTAAEAAAREALAIDPSNPDAIVLLAAEALDASKRPEARAGLEQVLAINPRHVEALALSAAIAQIEDRPADVAAFTQRAMAVRERNPDVPRIIGERVARQYRFEEAVRFLRQAVEFDPENSRAQASLGLHLLRTGDEAGARAALDAAFTKDPFDTVTYNLLTMLDGLEKFVSVPARNLVVRLHEAEAPVLQPYLVPLAEQALADLSKRYAFTPQGPILVEVFPRHDDFAVRTMGLPGMLGALGACFGKVVTMDSPKARPPGTFNWAAVLWHELAHVITLQMSGNRLPRWLSEGISTFEETRARAGWGRESELLFAQAYATGRLLPLKDLNSGFAKIETINLAYQQASVLVAYLVETHGDEKLQAFVRSFGEGLDNEAALTRAYGRTWETLQPEFDAYVKQKYGPYVPALTEVDAPPPGRTATAADWKAFADQHAGNFRLQMVAASPLLRLGDLAGARVVLERAAALVPFASGDASPWRLLASTALKQEQAADARRFMVEVLDRDHTAAQTLRQLVAQAQAPEDAALRQRAAERVIEIDPFDAAAHTALGDLALARGDVPTALRELKAAVDAGPTNPAEALTSLAEATMRSGRSDEAKRHLIRALETTPRHERAQELLLRIIDGPGGGDRR